MEEDWSTKITGDWIDAIDGDLLYKVVFFVICRILR